MIKNKKIRDIFWNLFGGGLNGVLIVLATPIYLEHLGLVGYAYITKWIMLQALVVILDFGMGATLNREFASSTDGSIKKNSELFKTLEPIYWILAGIAGLTYFIFSLSNDMGMVSYPHIFDENGWATLFLTMSVVFQLPASMYISGLYGFECHKLINYIQISTNILRYFGGVLILVSGYGLVSFFTWQAIISFCQVSYIRKKTILITGVELSNHFNLSILKNIWRYSAGMSLTAGLSIILANLDRILLGNFVSNSDYGRYGLAFTAVGLVQLSIQPFYKVYFPRYTQIFALNDLKKLQYEYEESTKILVILLLGIAITCFIYAPSLFAVWLGDFDSKVVLIFRLLLIGIGCSALSWLPAALQQAYGVTRLHAALVAISILIGAPLAYISIEKYGVLGGTVVWLAHGLIYISVGLWATHKYILKNNYFNWIVKIILPPLMIDLLIGFLSSKLYDATFSNPIKLVWMICVCLLMLVIPYMLQNYLIKKNHQYEQS